MMVMLIRAMMVLLIVIDDQTFARDGSRSIDLVTGTTNHLQAIAIFCYDPWEITIIMMMEVMMGMLLPVLDVKAATKRPQPGLDHGKQQDGGQQHLQQDHQHHRQDQHNLKCHLVIINNFQLLKKNHL